MRIFLINPPSTRHETQSWVWLEPLGLAYIAAVCRQAGHEVRIRDTVNTAQADIPGLFAEMDAFRPDLVGFSAMTENFSNGVRLARAVKARYSCAIVFGGWHVSGEPQAVLDPAIDYVVRSEGEDTILELLDCLQGRGERLENIQGIAYKDGKGGYHLTPPRARIKKLTNLPRPMREGLPIESYKWSQIFSVPVSRMKTLSVQASRGCPYKCIFCQTPALWTAQWTKRDATDVVDEIEELVNRYGINTLFFRDEEFTVRPNWVMEICEELCRRDLPKKVRWGSFARVDDASPELVTAMRKAGCLYVIMGIEASTKEEGERLKKVYTLEEAKNAFELFAKAGVNAQGSWVMGFPWDTLETLDRAFEWILTLPMTYLVVNFATPFASTALRDYVEKEGLLLSADTDRFTIREPLIQVPAIPMETLRTLRSHYERRFYLRPGQIAHMAGMCLRNPSWLRMIAEIVWDNSLRRFSFGQGARDAAVDGAFTVPPEYFSPLAAASEKLKEASAA